MEDVKSLKGLEVYKDGLIVEMVHGRYSYLNNFFIGY